MIDEKGHHMNLSPGVEVSPPAVAEIQPEAPEPTPDDVGRTSHRDDAPLPPPPGERGAGFNPAGAVVSVIGVVVLVLGLVALVRGDIDASFDHPVYRVLGMDHSPELSAIEIVAGIALMAIGFRRSLRVMLVAASVVVVASMVAFIEPTALSDGLSIDRGYSAALFVMGWAGVIAVWTLPELEYRRGRRSRDGTSTS